MRTCHNCTIATPLIDHRLLFWFRVVDLVGLFFWAGSCVVVLACSEARFLVYKWIKRLKRMAQSLPAEESIQFTSLCSQSCIDAPDFPRYDPG